MKTFKFQGAQGDMILIRRNAVPADATRKVATVDGRHIVAHSETGHHHTVSAQTSTFYETKDAFVTYLVVDEGGTDLTHHRDYDTHESIHIDAGCYELRRQREYTPEGLRMVQD